MNIAEEQHYTPTEVAKMWGVSASTVRRLFEDQPGVLKISSPTLRTGRKQKPHVRLSIPASVLARVHNDWSAGFIAEIKRRSRSV